MQKFKFGMGEKSISQENKLFISDKNKLFFHYLLFFDSRGLGVEDGSFNDTYLLKIKEFLDLQKSSYVIISKPKHLTIFATMYNFLQLNPNFSFEKLITNIGYVDLTPKKRDYLDDAILQIEQSKDANYSIVEHESYMLNDGSHEVLKSIQYSDLYIQKLSVFLEKKFKKVYFINTPIVGNNIELQRKRPDSFFTQLLKTNELIETITKKIRNSVLVDIRDINCTYDGVHYTLGGHAKIFTRVRGYI